jgi:hypothetical protein
VKTERERIATTEVLFRNVNEGIKEASDRFDSTTAEFVCECGDPACTDRVEVPLEAYEEVREEPTHFVVRPGHVMGPIETVVERKRSYAVIEKIDRVVARVARQLNPRPDTT